MKKVLLVLLISHTLLAQPAYHFDLLKDINSRTNDASIDYIGNVGNTAVIFHHDGDYNTNKGTFRLWKSNGTTMENFASSNQIECYARLDKPTIIDDYIFLFGSEPLSGLGNGLYIAKLNSPNIKRIATVPENPTVVKFNSKFYFGYRTDMGDGKLYCYNEATDETTEIDNSNLNFYNPTQLTVANNKLFFIASTKEGEYSKSKVWVSDGTSAGTHVVKEPAPLGSMYNPMCKIGNRVIYYGHENYNFSLYISDGTVSGTYPFKNIRSFGTHSGETVQIHNLYNFGDKALIFLAVNSTNQIWITDGTEANTRFVGYCDAIGLFNNTEIATKDGCMYFVGNTRLNKFDGTTITVLNNGTSFFSYMPSLKMVLNPADNNLYFNLVAKFYKTDGTKAGTQLINDKSEVVHITENTPFVVASNKVLAYTRPITYDRFGKEIYEIRSDTIKIVKDLDSTTRSSVASILMNAHDKTYFFATGEVTPNIEIFETDGTREGTRGVSLGDGNYLSRYVELNGHLYIFKNNQLQKINFSTRNYTTIKTLPQNISSIKPIEGNNKFYFIIGDSAKELWVSDGTAEGTVKISTFQEPNGFLSFAVNNQQLYIFTTDGSTTKVWKYNNDTTPPILLKTINSRYIMRTYANFRQKLAFIMYTQNGNELWATDGTTNGTTILNVFSSSSNPNPENIYFTDSDYYYASYIDNHIKVWKSNGTTTTLIEDIANPDGGVKEFCQCGNEIFFGLNRTDAFDRSFLYKYSPASNKTTLLNKVGRLDNNTVRMFYCLNRQLYFPAFGNGTITDRGRKFMYTSNGTIEGTNIILPLNNRPNPSNSFQESYLYPLNDQELLVLTNDKFYGIEWFTFRKCEPVLTNLDGIATDSKIQTSPTFIESTEKITAENKVYYYAPKSITLNAGFTANSQSVFKAEIKNKTCTMRE